MSDYMRDRTQDTANAAGRWASDASNRAQNVANQASDAMQRNYGLARDATNQGLEMVSSTVREQPLTTILVAIGVGWLIGRLRIV